MNEPTDRWALEYTFAADVREVTSSDSDQSHAWSSPYSTKVDDDWYRVFRALNDLLSLPENWDGYGAERPSVDYLEIAQQLLTQLNKRGEPAPARVVPLPTGGVLLDWQSSNQYLEAEISDLHVIEWMRRDTDGTYMHYDTRVDALDVEKELAPTFAPAAAGWSYDSESMLAA